MTASPATIGLVVRAATWLIFGLLWLAALFYMRRRQHSSALYLTLFTIFYIYLYKVLDYTLLQFQSLLLLQPFLPGLKVRGTSVGESLNLVPLASLTTGDLKTSLLNILMLMPFGFGLPFLTSWKMPRVIFAGAVFSISIELLQLVTGALAGVTFRIADINDVIFNTLGAFFGYLIFILFLRLTRMFPYWQASHNPIARYLASRPQHPGTLKDSP